MEIILIYLIAFIIGYMIHQLLYTKNNFRVGGEFKLSTKKYENILKTSYNNYETNTKNIVNDIYDSYHEDYCKDDGIHSKMCDILSDVVSNESTKILQKSVCTTNEETNPKKFEGLCDKIQTLADHDARIDETLDIKVTINKVTKDIDAINEMIPRNNLNKKQKQNADRASVLMQEIHSNLTLIKDALNDILSLKQTIKNVKIFSDKLICKAQSRFLKIDKICNGLKKYEAETKKNFKKDCHNLKTDTTFKTNFIDCKKPASPPLPSCTTDSDCPEGDRCHVGECTQW